MLPWSDFWERNYFAVALPLVGLIARNNFVRGGIAGVGFLTVLAGLAELGGVLAVRGSPDEPAASGK